MKAAVLNKQWYLVLCLTTLLWLIAPATLQAAPQSALQSTSISQEQKQSEPKDTQSDLEKSKADSTGAENTVEKSGLEVDDWGVWGQRKPETEAGDENTKPDSEKNPAQSLAEEFGVGIVGDAEREINLLDGSNLLEDGSGVAIEEEIELELKKFPEGI